MKKALSILLSLIMITATITALPFSAYADASGVCGDGVSYQFYSSTGELVISGSGAMYDFDETTPAYDTLTDNVVYITIEDGVTHVGNYAFDGYPNVEYVSVAGTVNDIGMAAFTSCPKLESVYIAEGVNIIGPWAFCESGAVIDVQIPNSVTKIYQAAFKRCNIGTLDLGTGVQEIGYEAFAYCYITELELPDSLQIIGGNAFSYNYMQELILPAGLTSIGTGAFKNCKYFESSYYCGTMEDFEALLESDYSSTFDSFVYFTEGSCGEDITYSFDLDNGTLYVYGYGDMDDYAGPYGSPFAGNSKIETIDFSDGINHIGSYNFARCSGLTEVDTNAAHSVGDFAFVDCTGLKKATLQSSVNEVGTGIFHSCSSLKTVDFGAYADVKALDFYGCTSLENITLSVGVEYVSMNSFSLSSDDFTISAYCHTKGVQEYVIDGTYRTWNKLHYVTTDVTPANLKESGLISKYCVSCGESYGETPIYYPKTIALSATSYTYDGKVKTPSVTVKDQKGKALKKGTDYTLTYQSGRKAVGTYTVTVKFKGNYSGTKKLTFKINPKGTTLSKVTAGKKAFTATWKKQATQTTGYQIQYSTDKNFKKNNKTVTIGKNTTLKTTVKKLTAKKKYYVRIRTYKTVSGTKYYSSWSAAKSVTTKK